MNTYDIWMSKFGEFSPAMQVGIMVCLATVAANALSLFFFFTTGFERVDVLLAATTCTTVLVSAPLGAFLVGLTSRLRQVAAQLDLTARTDDLTGLSTRTEFYLQVNRQMKMCDPAKGAGAILYIDADHFKRINDEFGHAIGDAVLQEIGFLVSDIIGEWDHAARFGGEEFAIFLDGADEGKAKWISHRILSGTRGIAGQLRVDGLQVSVSIGVAIHEPNETLEEVLIAADQCLYSAKNQGRNRVVLATSTRLHSTNPT
ncbi:diguanylate cyclase (GGDEF)-like protein [Phyllobacterium trifolii]|uniref:diguanylate cyclase n=1 Tax=Phyllobacterium trifolii TaxID=300193 RepID=A0A839UMA5_9HYPH|nr:GGDEF domain-containing protein [Phyllobacterium trifolii]MBB3149832.1 diguanylate cyclase (GGDEF)-like protein [Phyllobacterium trifolii]